MCIRDRNYNNRNQNNQNRNYRRVNYVRAEDNGRGRSYYQGRRSFDRNAYGNHDNNGNGRDARTNGGRSRSHEVYRRDHYEDCHQSEPRPTGNGNPPINQQDRRDEESEHNFKHNAAVKTQQDPH